ncbi:MAG: fluoride efflux transporter FluC [Bacillus sp. (in: firmicutes)]
MKNVILAGVGGGLGAVARYIVDGITPGPPYVYLFIINILGSLCLGLITGLVMKKKWKHWQGLMLGTGFCGGFTTFSAFAKESVELGASSVAGAISFMVLTTGAGMVFAWLGLSIGMGQAE